MGAESGMNSSVRDDRVALSDGAKALWGKTNRIDDSEWLPLYVHMVDSAAMASKIWDTWVPQGTKAVIVGDLGNDEVLARKLMIFMAGIHDIGKATPVFQAKSITFGPEAGSFAWKAERAGLPMIAGLRGTNHPTHPIAGEIILEGYLLRVRGWERKAARQYACVVGGHHGTPPDKSKIDEEKNRKTNVGLDSEAWVSTQDELIDFVANIAGIEEKEWEDLSERRFSVQSAVLMTGLVIMADWIASNSDEDMFPLVRTEPWADEDEDFFFSESGEEDDIQSWSGLRIRADRAWSCVQLPHAWVPEGIPSSCQDLFATRFTLPEGAKVRPVQEEAVRIARDTRQPGLMVIEAPMGEGKTEAALAAAEILAQRTGRGGVCVALPTMATTDAMFTRVRRWLEALPSCDFDNEKTVWLAHGKAQLNNDFRGIIAASHRRFSSVDQDDVKQESSQNRKKKQIDVPPETVVSDWLWGRKKGALANFLVCTVDQVLMSALQMKHVVLRQLAMANKVVIIDECHAYDAYMQEYLKMALEWLGGYRTPVILLSATLPECQRNAMVEAYLKGWCDTKNTFKTIVFKQAELVSNTRKRLSVARMMYQMRFPGEDVSGLTMQQLRGREGARIRRVYRECSERTGVEWDKRTYDHDDFDAGSEINKALSAANTCLYGLAHAAIVALGCSPGLGFVHVGHERSFVYDIADLYKAELSIPVAFETVAAKPEDIGSAVRHNIRDAIYDLSLMKRMTKDIRYLLGTSELEDDVFESDHVGLWDDKQGEVSAGKSYSDNDEWDGGTW